MKQSERIVKYLKDKIARKIQKKILLPILLFILKWFAIFGSVCFGIFLIMAIFISILSTSVAESELALPLDERIVVTAFVGGYDPTGSGMIKGHNGTDYTANEDSKVLSVSKGLVTSTTQGCPNFEGYGSYCGFGFGNHVVVQSGDYTITYGHLLTVGVNMGTPVDVGTALGVIGSTGQSTGTHLHLEIRKGGKVIDSREMVGFSEKQKEIIINRLDIPKEDFKYIDYILTKESNWRPFVENKESKAYGLCQALPGNKMESAGGDWAVDPDTQLKWCNIYAKERYGSWQKAYEFWLKNSWW